jgi:homoserine dehydrogenase
VTARVTELEEEDEPQVQHLVVVSVVGVGLVGSELVDQLDKLPTPGLRDEFQLLSLSSSRSTVYYDIDSDGWSNWRKDLAATNVESDVRGLATRLVQISTVEEVVGLQHGVSFSVTPVLVDNTSSEEVARLYPFFLNKGINIVTPNKKAFSSELTLYEEIVAASLKTGARFYNESTVGAGLPIISTIKELIATGDEVRNESQEGHRPRMHLPYFIVADPIFEGDENRRRILGHAELHLQRVLRRKE